LLPLPPYAPELNPMENVWEFMRGNDLSHRVWDGYKAIMLGAGRFVRSRCSAGGARRARM